MNRYLVEEYSWTMLNIVERFLYVPPAFVFIWQGMPILHTLDDDWWCHLFFSKFVLVVIFTMYSTTYIRYYTYAHTRTPFFCVISFSVSTPFCDIIQHLAFWMFSTRQRNGVVTWGPICWTSSSTRCVFEGLNLWQAQPSSVNLQRLLAWMNPRRMLRRDPWWRILLHLKTGWWFFDVFWWGCGF